MNLKAIIHIDDDSDDLSLFQDVIAEINPSYLLESFSDPREAISFLEETIMKPSIIFLDINMPVVSGKETLRMIRAIESLQDVPIVIFSTTIREADRKPFMELGANELLQKAGQFRQVVVEVDLVLRKFIKQDTPGS